ncbi:hypothetical protein U9M48_038658 [Paspalum notatum var. saurae]|uniref:Uncharacterized protein n=1 Tax=Paspalum notatum var. saurae TaxID=547442 RepID=A0AAQ3UHY1_PASNO
MASNAVSPRSLAAATTPRGDDLVELPFALPVRARAILAGNDHDGGEVTPATRAAKFAVSVAVAGLLLLVSTTQCSGGGGGQEGGRQQQQCPAEAAMEARALWLNSAALFLGTLLGAAAVALHPLARRPPIVGVAVEHLSRLTETIAITAFAHDVCIFFKAVGIDGKAVSEGETKRYRVTPLVQVAVEHLTMATETVAVTAFAHDLCVLVKIWNWKELLHQPPPSPNLESTSTESEGNQVKSTMGVPFFVAFCAIHLAGKYLPLSLPVSARAALLAETNAAASPPARAARCAMSVAVAGLALLVSAQQYGQRQCPAAAVDARALWLNSAAMFLGTLLAAVAVELHPPARVTPLVQVAVEHLTMATETVAVTAFAHDLCVLVKIWNWKV